MTSTTTVRAARRKLSEAMDRELLAWSAYNVSDPSDRLACREAWHAAWGEVERARKALAAIVALDT